MISINQYRFIKRWQNAP